jgi:hypothetical protein
MNQSGFDSLVGYVVNISRCDRWQAYQRLQEFNIPCHCSEDGQLRVEIANTTAAFLVRSVIQRLTASRLELVDWLEQCWQIED